MMVDAVPIISSKEAPATRPAASWQRAVTRLQAQHSAGLDNDVPDSFIGDKVLNVPSLIESRSVPIPAALPAIAPPRLAVMIHAARNLPGSTNSSTLPRMYAKASVHKPGQLPILSDKQKTHIARKVDGGVVWNSLLSLCPQQPKDMMLTITLKEKQQFTNTTVVWGTVSVPLSEVLASPAEWGERRQLQLQGHKLSTTGAALELQLFVSTERIQGPVSVLAATWNVGNATPPPPEQLQDWLRGTNQSLHHLVAVGAQECNYTRAAGRSMSRRTSAKGKGSMGTNSVVLAAAAEAAVAAVAETPTDSGPTSLPQKILDGPGGVPHGSSKCAASVLGSSQAATTFCSAAGGPTASAGVEESEDADMLDTRARPEQQQPQQQEKRNACNNSGHDAAGEGADGVDLDGWQSSAGDSRATQLKQYLLDQVDSATAWERHIAAALGPKYWLVGSKHMFQTRLLIFARVDVVPYISHIAAAYEATGIGHVGLNKGGVAISLKLDDTHLAFVSSHLAAHQSKIAQRNSDVSEICANIRLESPGLRPAAAGACLATGFHHLVWMGDLNYRLDYGQQAENFADSPTSEDFASLCDSISAGDFQQLLQLDQLRKEQAAGHVFAAFAEGHINFAPTFKVIKGQQGFSYAPKRSPAWCDRVLFKSSLPHKQGRCSSYFTAPDICTSDHKPVGAVLRLPLVTNTVTSGRSAVRTPFKLYVASVHLVGQPTWERIAELAAKSGTPAEVKDSGGYQWAPKSRKLKLVLSSACMAGPRQQHVFKVNHEAVAAGVAAVGGVLPAPNTAALTASLSLREENMPLLPGAVQDLQDDWLLLQLVLVEGLGLGFKTRTLARGIVPLQPAVQEYAARTFKAVQVPVHLECNGSAAGTATISLQLISSQTARQGMYEAIRRMRTLAKRHAGHSATEASRASSSKHVVSRTMSGTLLRFGNKVMEGMGMVRRTNS